MLGHFRTPEGRAAYTTAYDDALAEGPAPDRSADIATSFGTAHVHGWNLGSNKTPVILVPGRASGAPMWNELLPALIDDRPVYALDAIGDAGLSSQSEPLASTADQATWLAEAIVALGSKKAHVVGHSFGGSTAAALAYFRPEVVASLTLLEPVFVFATPPAAVFFWGTVTMLPLPQSWIDRALAEIGGTTVADVRKRTSVSAMIDVGAREYSAALPTPKRLDDDTLRNLTMPVYVGIADTKSLAGGDKAIWRATELLPNATVKVWENTTHSLPFQVVDKLGAELLTFWETADVST